MKKLLVIGLFFIIAVGLGVGVTAVYQNKQNIKQSQLAIEESQRESAQNARLLQDKKSMDTLAGVISNLRAECQKGVSAYDALSIQQKAKLQAPSCNTLSD